MATVRLSCPNCRRIDRLSVSAPLEMAPEQRRGEWLEGVALGQRHPVDAVCGLKCHLCGGWSIGVFSTDNSNGAQILSQGISNGAAVEASQFVDFLAVFPSGTNIDVHASVPEAAAAFFVEAKEDLASGRNPAGIISKCRSVLDLCLKNLDANGGTRKQRIADLRSKGLLTQGLADWADTLWDDGNDAIHDLTGDRKRAGQHVTFLELFFELAFALPAQVAAAREDAAD